MHDDIECNVGLLLRSSDMCQRSTELRRDLRSEIQYATVQQVAQNDCVPLGSVTSGKIQVKTRIAQNEVELFTVVLGWEGRVRLLFLQLWLQVVGRFQGQDYMARFPRRCR